MIVSKIGLCERMTSSSTTKIPWGLKDGFLKAQVLLLKNMCCIYVLYCWLESYHTLLKGFRSLLWVFIGKEIILIEKNSICTCRSYKSCWIGNPSVDFKIVQKCSYHCIQFGSFVTCAKLPCIEYLFDEIQQGFQKEENTSYESEISNYLFVLHFVTG